MLARSILKFVFSSAMCFLSSVAFTVKIIWKCLAIRKISCNFASLLGAICRLGIANHLMVRNVGGGECV